MSLNKKIVILILILSLTLNGVFLLPLKKAEAWGAGVQVNCSTIGAGLGVGVSAAHCSSVEYDIVSDIKKTVAEISKWTWEKFQTYLVDQLWPSLRDVIARRILNYITNETVKWIQGGGKPKFIGNWEGFVKDVGNIAFDSVMRETPLGALCSPFGLQIQIGLFPVDTYSDRITCTLDQVVSNIENFYVDFSVGGWRGYNKMWEPQNNYYSVAINIADEIVKRTSEKSAAATNEGLAGAGFMGDKVCKAGASKDSEVVGDAAFSDAADLCYEKNDACLHGFGEGDDPGLGGGKSSKVCAQELSACVNDATNEVAKKKGYNTDRGGEYCDPKDLVDANPGSMIGKAVGEAITSDGKWAANIQSWVSALVNAVINRVIKEGVLYLQEITSDKPEIYYPPEYQSMLAQELEKDKQVMRKEIKRFTDEWFYLLNVKNQSLSYASSTKATLEQLWQIQLNEIPLPSDCEPAVTIEEIQAVQTEIDRLNNEIKDPQAKIDAAKNVISQIDKADFFDEFQRAEVQTAYQNFINQYGTTAQLEQIISGSARDAADAEKQTKKTELDNVQARLSVCQAAILAGDEEND